MRRLLLVTFASGFAALSYEVVWLSVLSGVVGSTSVAASVTLAVFFLGLGVGAFHGGRIAAKTRTPLLACAKVELGLALFAGVFLVLLGPVGDLHRELFGALGHGATLVVALVLLLPPSVLMGATLPLVGEVFVGRPENLGRGGSLIYASNTVGGALGAAVSAFWLIAELGVAWTCAVAAGFNLVAAAALFALHAGPRSEGPRSSSDTSPTPRAALALAAVSGFFMLALEVLWTRMMTQVVQNSAYTFGAILLVFLTSLALGSGLTSIALRFDQVRRAARAFSAFVCLAAMAAVVWSPHQLAAATSGYELIEVEGGLAAYVGRVVLVCASTFLPAAVLGGMLFPLSLQLAGPVQSSGRSLGVLGSINTLAAIAGSLVGGFVLVRSPFGLYRSLAWIAGGYALCALLLVAGRSWRSHVLRAVAVALGAVATMMTLELDPPLALDRRERLVVLEQGVGAIVAVTEERGNLRIKVNNHYTLGSTRGTRYQKRQGTLPLLLHPAPARVFFIGLGSGITASAALQQREVEELTVVELTAEVVTVGQEHFARTLHESPRARVEAGDARHHLRTHEESYDVIVGDLFVPWRAGVGNLYSVEHFEVVRERLRPGGVFAQWVPLYQVSRDELAIITRTMIEVFGEVELWRGDFDATRSIVALVARRPGGAEYRPAEVASRVDEFASRNRTSVPRWMRGYGLFELYVGHVDRESDLVASAPLNTDRRPVIAYQAPRTQRAVLAGEAAWLSGTEYLQLMRELAQRHPTFDEEARRHARAGFLYHERAIHRSLGESEDAERATASYRALRGVMSTAGR